MRSRDFYRIPPSIRLAVRQWVAVHQDLQAQSDAALAAAGAAHLRQQALAAERQQLQAELIAAQAQLPTLAARADARAAQITALSTQQAALRTAWNEATARLLDQTATDVPLLLLPVRVETRFERTETGGTADALKIRISPDDIHIHTHEPALTDVEEQWGRHYWTETLQAADDIGRQVAFAQLVGRFGSRRASWIAQALDPASGETVEKRAASWTRAPRAVLLPDRWVAIAYEGTQPVGMAWSESVREPLAAGPSPVSQAPAPVLPGIPTVDADMAWMLDFEAALGAGMALRLPLTAQQAKGIDRLLVLGIKGSLDPDSSAQRLAELLAAQRFSQGLALVPPHTPTNNTADVSSGHARTERDSERAYAIERGAPLVAVPLPPEQERLDGHWLAWALGVPVECFAHIEYADGRSQRDTRRLFSLLLPRTDSLLLRALGLRSAGGTMTPEQLAPGGALPAIRVGAQPYGLLPVTAYRGLLEGPGQDPAAPLYAQRVVSLLRKHAALAPSITRGHDLPTILNRSGMPCGFVMQSFANGATPIIQTLSPAELLSQRPGPLAALPAQVDTGLALEVLAALLSRPEPWVLAFAAQRLQALRATRPTGLRLGAYGYVEDLRPTTTQLVTTSVATGLPDPVCEVPDNMGFILAPSLRHAAAAAVLRSGYLARQDDGAAVDLSSQRVRRASWLLAGVRQGQSLGALLGYRFERHLQEDGLAAYIAPFRTLAGLKQEGAVAEALATVQHKELAKQAADARVQDYEAAVRAVTEAQGLCNELRAARDNYDMTIQNFNNALHAAEAAVQAAQTTLTTHLTALPRSIVAIVDDQVDIDRIHDSVEFEDWGVRRNSLQARLEQRQQQRYEQQGRLDALRTDLAVTQARRAEVDQRLTTAINALHEKQTALQALERQQPTPAQQQQQATLDLAGARAALRQALTVLWQDALESIVVSQVVDGVELHQRWRMATAAGPDVPPRWDAQTIPFGDPVLGTGERGFPAPGSLDFLALQRHLSALAEEVDAVGDLLVAESVFQLVNNNPLRAGVTLDVVAKGETPPAELEFVRTPRTGTAVTHRIVVLLPAAPPTTAHAWNMPEGEVRAAVEPVLEAWVRALLPDPAQVVCPVLYRDSATAAVFGSERVSLLDLQLSALDFISFVTATERAQRSDLEQHILYVALRRTAAPPGSVIELQFERTETTTQEQYSFLEAIELAATIRALFAGTRAVEGEDLTASGALVNASVALTALEDRAGVAEKRVSEVQQALQQAQQALQQARRQVDPSGAAVASALEAMRAALIHASLLGVAGAVPLEPCGASEQVCTTLDGQCQAALQELTGRLAVAARLAQPAAQDEAARRRQAMARVQVCLGADFQILPAVTLAPPAAAALGEALAASTGLQGDDPLTVDRWLQRVAAVREGASHFLRVLHYAEATGAQALRDLFVGQCPYTAGDRWLALPSLRDHPLARGRTSLVVHAPFAAPPLDQLLAGPLTGVLIDEWVEVIPSATELTGVAFHYDAPSASAPQAALLAVAPDPQQTVWDLDSLQATVIDTLEAAKARVATPETGAELVWFDAALPRGAVPGALPTESWQWVAASPRPVCGKLAHRSPSTPGLHQHFFQDAVERMFVNPGDTLFAYVYLERVDLPRQLMLQWQADQSWEHRAFWGEDLISWGSPGSVSRCRLGLLPPPGQWLRLQVPAAAVGLEGKEVTGMAFTLFDGRATWDCAGRIAAPAPAVPWDARRIDRVWLRDCPPAGARLLSSNEAWCWVSRDPAPFDGRRSHQAESRAGMHQHFFDSASPTLSLSAGDLLFCYVYLPADPALRPRQLMLQWLAAGSWEQRAFWGEDLIGWGVAGTASRLRRGDLPEAGKWLRLNVPVEPLNLAGKDLTGMAFTLFDGTATWGPAGVASPPLTPLLFVT